MARPLETLKRHPAVFVAALGISGIYLPTSRMLLEILEVVKPPGISMRQPAVSVVALGTWAIGLHPSRMPLGSLVEAMRIGRHTSTTLPRALKTRGIWAKVGKQAMPETRGMQTCLGIVWMATLGKLAIGLPSLELPLG